MALHAVMMKIIKSMIYYIFVNNDFTNLVENTIVRRLPGTHNKNTWLNDYIFLKCNLNLN